MDTPHRLFVVLIALTLGGCGEFAYKTGAGADALAVDKQACQQTSSDLQACMHAKGWTIANLSGDDSPAMPVAATSSTAAAPSAPMAASAPGAPPTVVTASAVATASARVDPLAPVKMTAWVKFGGGGPQDDIDACVAKLGPANAPDTIHHTATRALLGCMKEKGWRGL